MLNKFFNRKYRTDSRQSNFSKVISNDLHSMFASILILEYAIFPLSLSLLILHVRKLCTQP